MPDIVIAGATFRGVPQIDIPKDGSGTASFVYEEGTKQITENGTNIDVSGYAAVDVAVPSTAPVIQSLSVTQNGEYTAPSGVDGYSPVTVNVPGIVPSGSQTVTDNGTYDVTALAQMIVNVSGGGGSGLEYEEGTWSPSQDTNRGTVSFQHTHSAPPSLIIMMDVGDTFTPTNSGLGLIVVDYKKIFGSGYMYNSSDLYIGLAGHQYRASGSSASGNYSYIRYDASDPGDATTVAYYRYFATESNFYPYTANNSRYWRSGRTYKWKAFWL